MSDLLLRLLCVRHNPPPPTHTHNSSIKKKRVTVYYVELTKSGILAVYKKTLYSLHYS